MKKNKIDKDKLSEAINSSKYWVEVTNKLGCTAATAKKYAKIYKIDTSRFNQKILSKIQLEEAIKKAGNWAEVGEILKCEGTTAKKNAIKYGIDIENFDKNTYKNSRRRKSVKLTNENVLEAMENSKSWREAGDYLKTNPVRVKYFAVEHNISVPHLSNKFIFDNHRYVDPEVLQKTIYESESWRDVGRKLNMSSICARKRAIKYKLKHQELDDKRGRWVVPNLGADCFFKIDLEELQKIIYDSRSWREIGRKLNRKSDTVKKYAQKHNLDIDNLEKSWVEKEIGKKYGKLTILEGIKKENGNNYTKFKCLCDCGRSRIVRRASLLSGAVTCCSIARHENSGENHYNFSGYKKLSGNYFNRIKKSAEKRNLDFNITKKYIYDLFLEQKGRCSYTDLELHLTSIGGENQTASLDRIDSSKGYVKGNVQWVHKKINIIKWGLSEDEFIKYCHLVSLKHAAKS